MPEISRFFGIVIKIYFSDHPPPHFHAEYSEHAAVIEISTLSVISGQLPPRVLGLVTEWASLHQTELLNGWDKAHRGEAPGRIQPLE